MGDGVSKLALHGGSPVREAPLPARGHIGAEEVEAVSAYLDKVVATGTMGAYQGEEEEAYCAAFAEYLGGGYADAVSSGSAAIYVALLALELEAFSEVIIGPFTDPGGIMPIPLQSMIPMIADSAPGSFNTGPEQIEALISPRTSAIIVPHIAGEPADIGGIMEVAGRHGIPVIEDCAQAHGARFKGQLAGSFGDLSAFSTNSGKNHSSGGQGGMVFTRDEALYQSVRRMADRGKPHFLLEGATNMQATLNFNQTDLAAVFGLIQLRKLPEMIERRQAIVGQLIEGTADAAMISIQRPGRDVESSNWFLPVAFYPDRAACDKETFCESVRAEGLPVTDDYRYGMPHRQAWYTERRVFGSSGYPWASPLYEGDPNREFACPNAQAMLKSHFTMTLHENWSTREIDDVIAIFQKVAAAYRAG